MHAAPAPGALGEDAYGADASFQVVCGGEDGAQGFAVVFPVYGQVARSVAHGAEEGYLHV